jgi:sulfide:quinone oxidoreductase
MNVLIAGGGVAAVEAALALRELADERVSVVLLAPSPELVHRPSAVETPFTLNGPPRIPLARLADLGVSLRRGALAAVDPQGRAVTTSAGDVITYDRLLIAVGAIPREAVPGAITFTGPGGGAAVEGALRRLERDPDRGLVFVLPAGASWALPMYELALMSAQAMRERLVQDAALGVVSPEARPLELFGAVASDAVARLLHRAAIDFHGSTRATTALEGALLTDDGRLLRVSDVIALPLPEGPRIAGLPHDDDGFLPVDDYGRVQGCNGVYAAGDAAAHPVKQGGLATQQADAAAEAIAAEAGAPVDPTPFRPVLRGLLLTGDAPLYLRAELGADPVAYRLPGAPAIVSRSPLWWPTVKVAGRHLARFVNGGSARGRLADWAPHTTDRDERAATIELMARLADEDAAVGDYRQALQALDSAAALAGGDLPRAYAEKRAAWMRTLGEAAGARP